MSDEYYRVEVIDGLYKVVGPTPSAAFSSPSSADECCHAINRATAKLRAQVAALERERDEALRVLRQVADKLDDDAEESIAYYADELPSTAGAWRMGAEQGFEAKKQLAAALARAADAEHRAELAEAAAALAHEQRDAAQAELTAWRNLLPIDPATPDAAAQYVADTIWDAARAARLEQLVEQAYREGWQDGGEDDERARVGPIDAVMGIDESWQSSAARRALAGEQEK